MKRSPVDRRANSPDEWLSRYTNDPRLHSLVAALLDEPDPGTAHDTFEEIWWRDIVDSLSALPALHSTGPARVADAGSGIGFPALPLAVALPTVQFTLIDSSQRKLHTARNLALRANIANVVFVHERLEHTGRGPLRERFDAALARALAPLPIALELTAPLVRVSGLVVVWRGRRNDVEERSAARAAEFLGLECGEVIATDPFPGARSLHLHLFHKRQPTPSRYPRNPARIRRSPL